MEEHDGQIFQDKSYVSYYVHDLTSVTHLLVQYPFPAFAEE